MKIDYCEFRDVLVFLIVIVDWMFIMCLVLCSFGFCFSFVKEVIGLWEYGGLRGRVVCLYVVIVLVGIRG